MNDIIGDFQSPNSEQPYESTALDKLEAHLVIYDVWQLIGFAHLAHTCEILIWLLIW